MDMGGRGKGEGARGMGEIQGAVGNTNKEGSKFSGILVRRLAQIIMCQIVRYIGEPADWTSNKYALHDPEECLRQPLACPILKCPCLNGNSTCKRHQSHEGTIG
jgi:hypothetical protein